MDQNAKRYARRILLIHLLLLVIVLVIVAEAARETYVTTREKLIAQAEERQKLLASETATGIQNHYRSILNDLDLLHQLHSVASDQSDSDIPEIDRPAETNFEKAADRNLAGRGPVIADVMWRQLRGRVSMLFMLDPNPPPTLRPPGDPNRRGGNQQFMIDPAITAMHLPPDVHPIGFGDKRLDIMSILDQSRSWIVEQKYPSFDNFARLNEVGFNLVCIPMTRNRQLVGVVPISAVQKLFLQPLNSDPANGAWLIDEAGTAMAASRPELIGMTVSSMSDPELKVLADQFIENHKPGEQLITRDFKIGAASFAPSMISEHPVLIGNRQWALFITTSLTDVNALVLQLLHKAILWSIFVVLSITAILVSTAVQMIRSRMRMERVRHESLTRELEQARQIQLAWLPDQHPRSDAIDIAAVNSPASHISGDFYNWFELPDGRLVVTVGDVTGHGMAAAFLMATTQLLVRNTMVRLCEPGRCLEEVNRQLCVQVFNGQFVTMLVMILDLKKGRMQVATAGHPAPLLADGESFQPLPIEPQLVLGVDRDTKYVTEQYPLPRHAGILLYTDGVVECPDATLARFGDERLRRALYGKYQTAQEMLEQVTTAVDAFRGPRALDDDLTMVAIQLQPVRLTKPESAVVVS